MKNITTVAKALVTLFGSVGCIGFAIYIIMESFGNPEDASFGQTAAVIISIMLVRVGMNGLVNAAELGDEIRDAIQDARELR